MNSVCLWTEPSQIPNWMDPLLPPSHPASEKTGLSSRWIPPHQSDPPQLLDMQLDFFHKLGYSTAQVQAVQKKFGPNTDTDKVLGELVRVRADPEALQWPLMSALEARGDPPATGVTLQLSHCRDDGGEEDDSLRPIVIDGSNVAMR